jgi:hypothetical protein
VYGHSRVFIYQGTFDVLATPAIAAIAGVALLPSTLEVFAYSPILDDLPVPCVALPATFSACDIDIFEPLAFVPPALIDADLFALPHTAAAAVSAALDFTDELAFIRPALIDELPPPFVALPSSFVSFPGNILEPLAFVAWPMIEEAPPPLAALPSSFAASSDSILAPLAFVQPVLVDEAPPLFVALPSSFATSDGGILEPLAYSQLPAITDEFFAAPHAAVVAVTGALDFTDELAFIRPALIDDEIQYSFVALPSKFVTFPGNILDPLAFVSLALVEESPPPFVALPAKFTASDGGALEHLAQIVAAIHDDIFASPHVVAVAVTGAVVFTEELAFVPPALIDDEIQYKHALTTFATLYMTPSDDGLQFVPFVLIDDPFLSGYPPPVRSAVASPRIDEELGFVVPLIPDELVPISAVVSPIGSWNMFGDIFLYTEANWSGVVFVFQSTLRATSGTGYARAYDKTLAAEVAGSIVSSVALNDDRVRSGPIILVDGHEYQAQVAKSVGGTAFVKSARYIAAPV